MTEPKAIKRNATSQHAIIVGGMRSAIFNPSTKREILSLRSDAERVEAAAKEGNLKIVRNVNQHVALYQISDKAVFRSVKL